MKSKGYPEDVKLSNLRLLMGTVIIGIALLAQFYNKKFPENRNFLIGCIISYPFFSSIFPFFFVVLNWGHNCTMKGIINILVLIY